MNIIIDASNSSQNQSNQSCGLTEPSSLDHDPIRGPGGSHMSGGACVA